MILIPIMRIPITIVTIIVGIIGTMVDNLRSQTSKDDSRNKNIDVSNKTKLNQATNRHGNQP